jgi:general secretion pathway protein A
MPNDLFGFSENPFADGHDPRFLYPGRSHREAVAHLRRALESREPFALLTGLPGVGKTAAVETALAGTGPHTRVTIVATPTLTREEFLEQVLAGFAPDTDDPPHRTGPAGGIEACLRVVTAMGRTAVLVVEEAQDLDQALLDDLRLYSNLEAGGQALLQIILVARPVLEETLSDPACQALRQRIAVGYRLDPLSERRPRATSATASRSRGATSAPCSPRRPAALSTASRTASRARSTSSRASLWRWRTPPARTGSRPGTSPSRS